MKCHYKSFCQSWNKGINENFNLQYYNLKAKRNTKQDTLLSLFTYPVCKLGFISVQKWDIISDRYSFISVVFT